jgi:Fic-DOC domain mobile mystery protein B
VNDLFAQAENGTDLTHEEREGLRQTWITTRADLNEAEQANIDEAMAWTGRIGNRDLLTEDFVFELHRRMFGDVWTWAGTTRRTNKNIGVDKTLIHVRLGGLVRDAQFWIEKSVFSRDEIAIRFHHGLAFIHVFPNGNGRHARLIADLVVAQLGGEPFTWGGGGNLQAMNDLRDQYIHAIRTADHHDFEELLMFARS